MTREQKMERRKTEGKIYVYKPNPYDKCFSRIRYMNRRYFFSSDKFSYP